MAKTALLEVQKAIFDTLTNDATFSALVTGVFDEVPDNRSFPYVTIGDNTTEVPFDTFGRDGKEVTKHIHIWSNYEGFKEAYDILEEMNRLLDNQQIPINQFDTVLVHYVNGNTIAEPLNHIVQLIARYRIIVQNI